MPTGRALSAEARLVFRTVDPTCSAAELATIVPEIRDWERAARLSEREGATGALWRLIHAAEVSVPDEVREFLRTRTMLSDFRMQSLAERASAVVETFFERGIPVILLKGAAIGALVDPTFRARPMTDIDLLIRPADAERARDAVIAAGWPQTTDERLLELLKEHHHLAPFVHPQLPGLRLELHTELLPRDHSFAISDDALWDRSRPADAPFAGARLLELEMMAIHVCIHFAWQHTMHFAPWRTFRALALITAHREWSWDRFAAAATAAKAASVCYWTLRLAEHLGAHRAPDAVLRELAPPTPRWVMRGIERHFVADLVPGESQVSPSIGLSRALWRVALRPGWSGHRAPGRDDPSRRWERAFGLPEPDGPARLARRHARSYREWWDFVTQTLVGL